MAYLQKTLFLIFLPVLALCSFAQQTQTTVAVLPSDGTALGNYELETLTDKMREAALNVLPASSFILLKQDVVIKRLGGAENYVRECTQSSCIVDLGKKAQVDYVAQASVGKLGGKTRLKVELYNVRTEGLVGMFSDEAEDIRGLLSIIENKAPETFSKIPGASRRASSPLIAGGISGLQSAGGYEFSGDKRYLANINTEPKGAALSFNGVPDSRCVKAPCKATLAEGNVRIVAALEQHETADTTVFINQNNQNINIMLKSNFGVLEVKPAYIDGIGGNRQWSLSINGQAASSWASRLSPNKYSVRLSHECYETLNFDAGINKDSREVFDMASHVKLKMGGLILNMERDGELVSEPVFVDGKHAGETPFSGSLALCSEIDVGMDRRSVNIKLKHNDNVSYTVKGAGNADTDFYDINAFNNVNANVSEDSGVNMGAVSLGILGTFFIAYGLYQDSQINTHNESYKARTNGDSQSAFTSDIQKAEDAKSSRNLGYILGAALLASGISVQVFF